MKEMAGQLSIATDKRPLDMFEEKKAAPYIGTEKDTKLVGKVLERYEKMRSKRTAVDRYWELYQKMWDAIYIPYSDGRSRSNVPLEMAIIELFVAEAMKRKTQFRISESNSKFKTQSEIFQRVWKWDWETYNREHEILRNEYITAIFGTSVMYTGFEMKSRVIMDPTDVGEDGKMDFERKLQTFGEIIMKNFDIRNFYLDEKAKCMEEAVDCIAIEYVSGDTFENYSLNPNYKNLDSVIPIYQYNDDNNVFITKEERAGTDGGYVKLMHYWNAQADVYCVIANDKVVIREHPILNASKSLPFVVRQYSHNPFSIYGRGLCEILMTFKSDLNTLREMLMDAIRRSNNQVVAVGDNLTFDGNYFAYNNQILQFKGQLGNGNFQQLSGNPPNQAIFNYIDRIFKDIAIFSGIDIQNLLGDPQQTAYQTAVQKESSLQRVNVVLSNRDIAFQRLGDLHKDNLMQFFPMKMVRKLVPVNENNEPKEEIESEYPKIPLDGENFKGGKFQKGEGKNLFEITPERIRGQVDIDVFTNLNTPTINEVEKEQKMNFFTQLPAIMQSYGLAPELESIMPKKNVIREMAELFNVETESESSEEVSKARDSLIAELQGMMGGGAPAPAPAPMETQAIGATPPTTEQELATITNL